MPRARTKAQKRKLRIAYATANKAGVKGAKRERMVRHVFTSLKKR